MKKIFLLIIILLVSTLFIYFFSLNSNHKTNSVNNQSQNQSSKNIDNYYKVYQDPYVIYLRKSLNAYLADDSSGVNISMAAVKEDRREGIITGLDAFDKSYYKSKFVVLTIGNNIGGGKDIQILFQDKPDRIFYAWVYKLSTGDYELRGFNSRENFDKQAMDKIISSYKFFIFDKNHSI